MSNASQARTWANLNGCKSLTDSAAEVMFSEYRKWSARKAFELYFRIERHGA